LYTPISLAGTDTSITNTSMHPVNEAAIPEIPNYRYAWTRSAPHLAPHDLNPDFAIRGFK
jgi:hypothetical protein